MPSSVNPCNHRSLLRSMYQPDRVQALKPSHEYSGAVIHNSLNQKTINNSVVVTSVDDKTRTEALAYFNMCQHTASEAQHNHESEKNKGIAAIVMGITTGLGGGVGLAAALISPPVAAAAIVAGVVSAAFGSHKTSENQQIINNLEQDRSTFQQQIKLWKDPIYLAVEQRQLSGSQGFRYVFDNNLKNRIVHSEEVKALWIRDFSNMFSAPQSIGAFSVDLLGKNKLDYAWSGAPFHDLEINNRKISASLLKTMASRYQECSRDYQHFNDKIKAEVDTLNNQYQSVKEVISNQRNLWLQPAHHTYNRGVNEARILYNRTIERFASERDFAISEIEQECMRCLRHGVHSVYERKQIEAAKNDAIARVRREYETHPAVIAIEDAYRKDRLMCTFLFDQSKLVVDSFFDQRTDQLDAERSQARQQIEQQRSAAEPYFANTLNQILQGSKESIRQLRLVPPTVNRQWTLSSFGLAPSWNDVYSRVPSFQSAFATTLTKDAWNLFWGAQGLGMYASSSINSWNQPLSEKSHFPFQQCGFNLHVIPHQPRRGMFCQRVNLSSVRPMEVAREPVVKMGFGGSKRREENPQPVPSNKEIKTVLKAGFGDTTRREEKCNVDKNSHVKPGSGLGRTVLREEIPQSAKSEVNTVLKSGFGGTARR